MAAPKLLTSRQIQNTNWLLWGSAPVLLIFNFVKEAKERISETASRSNSRFFETPVLNSVLTRLFVELLLRKLSNVKKNGSRTRETWDRE